MTKKKKRTAVGNGHGNGDVVVSDNKNVESEPPPDAERHDSGTEEESHEGNSPTNGVKDSSTEKEKAGANGTPPWTPPEIKKRSRFVSLFLGLIRAVLLDLPLMLVFGVYASMMVVEYIHDQYLYPQLELMKWTPQRQIEESTYFHRVCDENDLSATTVEELVIGPNFTTKEAVDHHLTHGVSIFPDLLPDPLLDELRDFVLERNKKEEGFWVIEPEHRSSFGIGANMEPVVAEALKQIATHRTLRPFLEETVGKNPAIIEFTAITSEYGAAEQFYHADVLPYASHTKNARSMIPSYSLFVPLQDTTAAMGATHVCPGSHVCGEEPDYCVEKGYQVSGTEDLWKKGTAFVFNQGFFHCGKAHTDPNGIERVAFIISFAPRPRYRDGELESRILSQGGSYSLRWDHWGHTLQDLEEADTAMTYPWVMLRSLGLYKPPDRDWGWDMITVASYRIINDDNGYHDDDLEGFIEKGGFKYLPAFLHGSMDGHDDSEEPLWYEYLLETFHKCKDFALKVNVLLVGVYLAIVIVSDVIRLFNAATSTSKLEAKSFFLFRSVRRLVVTHGLVLVLAFYMVRRVDNTQWADQVRSGKLYQVPLDKTYNTAEEKANPGTMPSILDVLIPSRYNSDYLGAYNDYLHVGHPANREWKAFIALNAGGYSDLPRFMQDQVSEGIVNGMQALGSRFLIQKYGFYSWGRWYELPDSSAAMWTRRELLMESHPALKAINTKVEHLLSETKFGIHSETALHRVHIPKLLTKIQEAILAEQPQVAPRIGKPRKCGLGPVFKLPPLPPKPTHPATRSPMPPLGQGEEPFPGAWMKEGDDVEAMYQSRYPEWYKGKISFANSWAGNYDVNYDDGDTDPGLCRTCVRPFVPYSLGEKVEARLDPNVDAFYEARIAKIHPDGTFDIKSASDQTRRRVPATDIRRGEVDHRRVRRTAKQDQLDVGSIVDALYQGTGQEWFRGTITRVRKDGTFDVEYDDGDFEAEVERRHIRLAV